VSAPPRVSRSEWNEEYVAGRWEYLADDAEVIRYQAVCRWAHEQGMAPSVLDVGCGSGMLYRALGGTAFPGRYLGVDWSVSALARVPRGRGHAAICADAALRLPLAASFDVIVCTETLYYLPDPLAVVDGLRDLLNDGGELLISQFQPDRGRHPAWHAHIAWLDQRLGAMPALARHSTIADPSGRRTWTLYALRKEHVTHGDVQ
jgi:SAM-dependent methyltransferase